MDQQTVSNTLYQILNQKTFLEDTPVSLSAEDWEELLLQAKRQGLTLLLYDRLHDLKGNGLVPQTVLERLREGYLQATAKNMVMLYHAGIILEALKERKMDVIVLKGLYLAEAVFPSIGLRTFSDLDLLVRKGDLIAALTVMQGLGYQLTTWYDVTNPNLDIKHVPPMKKNDAPIVELHWGILEEDAPFAIDVDGLWQRAIPARIADSDVLALDLEDLILHLCIHLTYQHRLGGGVKYLYDIAEVLRRFEGQIEWQQLAVTAKEWGAERVIWLTLRLLQETTVTEVPPEVLQQLLPVTPAPGIVEEALRRLTPAGKERVIVTPDLAALSEVNGLGRQLKLIASRVFIPRQVMARLYNVDPHSPGIYGYYFVRFTELFRHYSGAAWRFLIRDDAVLTAVKEERTRGELIEWMAKRRTEEAKV
jgi:hypothetical protein